MTEEDERKCQALWTAIKDMDTLNVGTDAQKSVLNTALAFMAKDANIIFKMVGFT